MAQNGRVVQVMGPVVDVVINEVLTNTDVPLTDAIELYNTTGASVDVSGWLLSDSLDRLNQANEFFKRNLEPMDVKMAIDLNRTQPISRSEYGNINRHSVIFNSNDLNFWIAKPEEPQKAPACYGTYTGFNLSKELYGQGHDPEPPYFPAKDK